MCLKPSGQYWMVNDDVLFYLPGCKKCPLGQPGALQPAAGVCQHLRQLVWLHASGPLSVSLGPCALQRSSVCPAQEVQRLGESVKMRDEMDRKTRKQHQRLAFWTAKWANQWWTVKMGYSRLCGMWAKCQWGPFVIWTKDNHQTDPGGLFWAIHVQI